jgi:hypothetical protein
LLAPQLRFFCFTDAEHARDRGRLGDVEDIARVGSLRVDTDASWINGQVVRAKAPLGYKLFTRGLIPSMSKNDMQKVYRLLRITREQGDITWESIVDETRELERVATWDVPEEYAADATARDYRRDFWNQQPHRVQVWSEKGTVRGVLKPVLDHYAVSGVPTDTAFAASSFRLV